MNLHTYSKCDLKVTTRRNQNDQISKRQIRKQYQIFKKLAENEKLVISVKAHKAANYSDYVRVIDQLKMANATRISIAESN